MCARFDERRAGFGGGVGALGTLPASAAATDASASATADAVDALFRSTQSAVPSEPVDWIELHPNAVSGATASSRELRGEGVVSSTAPARRLGPSRQMLRDVRALTRRAVRSCMQAETAMKLAGIARHEGAAHASARHGALSGAAGGPLAPAAASAQHGASAAAMHAEQGHEDEDEDEDGAQDGAAMGADEVADGDEAAAAAVNATLTLAATAPGTAPDVVLASRAALSATYRAIRHEGQIEPDRRRLMTPDGS